MSRRTHKKSRAGCLECKQRHIKCDESQPRCILCKNSDRICSFTSYATSTPQTPASVTLSTSVIDSPPTSTSQAPSSIAKDLGYHGLESDSVNLLHLNLFQHIQPDVFQSNMLGLAPSERADIAKAIIGYALDSQFLMSNILALSALHLSTIDIQNREAYKRCAVTLQNSAIKSFSESPDDDSLSTCAQRFLFASFLGLQRLHQVLAAGPGNLSQLIEDWETYLRLSRGVRAQLGEDKWPRLHQTNVGPLLLLASKLEHLDGTIHVPECETLENMLISNSLDSTTQAIYLAAIANMRLLFRLMKLEDPAVLDATSNLIFAWPVMISIEYIELLTQRRPEALVILAFYGGLLHLNRDSWIVGDGGRDMIELTRSYLGPYWQNWLSWPVSLIK